MKWSLLVAVALAVTFALALAVTFFSRRPGYPDPIVVNDLLSPEETENILETAKTRFNSSTVLSGRDDSIRKSETAWIKKDEPVVRGIFERFAKRYKFNLDNVEDLQVVRYTPGGFYNEHHDACCQDNDHCRDFVKKSGQRVLTILIYLNDDFEDGHTEFPNLGLRLRPPKNGGIVFGSLEKGVNMCDPAGLHKGTPVTSGTKYICNIWVREKKF